MTRFPARSGQSKPDSWRPAAFSFLTLIRFINTSRFFRNRAYVYDLDDVCAFGKTVSVMKKRSTLRWDFFARRDDGLYERESEAFSERAYTHKEICALLQKNGLILLDCFGDDSFAPPKDDTQRIIYAARSAKKKG